MNSGNAERLEQQKLGGGCLSKLSRQRMWNSERVCPCHALYVTSRIIYVSVSNPFSPSTIYDNTKSTTGPKVTFPTYRKSTGHAIATYPLIFLNRTHHVALQLSRTCRQLVNHMNFLYQTHGESTHKVYNTRKYIKIIIINITCSA